MLKSYLIMPALCSILKTMHNARYNARLICAGLTVTLSAHARRGLIISGCVLADAYNSF